MEKFVMSKWPLPPAFRRPSGQQWPPRLGTGGEPATGFDDGDARDGSGIADGRCSSGRVGGRLAAIGTHVTARM
jgi:hypothetical protein